jgi:hypothetical protein
MIDMSSCKRHDVIVYNVVYTVVNVSRKRLSSDPAFHPPRNIKYYVFNTVILYKYFHIGKKLIVQGKNNTDN